MQWGETASRHEGLYSDDGSELGMKVQMMKVIMHSGKLVDASALVKRIVKYATQI